MKRSRQYGSGSAGRLAEESASLGLGALDPEAPDPAWAEVVDGKPEEAFVPYALSSHFGKGALLSHVKFGKGAVVRVDGPRIEVVFSDAKRTLAHRPG